MKPYVKIALLVVMLIAISGILAGLMLYNKKHTDTSKAKPDYVLTATVLQKEFEDNEKTASVKYINRIIEVSGSISSVTKSDSSNVNISLKTGSDLSAVSCTFTANTDASLFKIGDDIVLRGECEGYLMDVQLKNCAKIMKKN
jgi:hypothetical protein